MSTTQELHDLPAQYDPGQTERAIYERWVEAGVFSADERRSRRNGGDRDPFVIIMPPPNVTAVLHMGHGLNNTVQDVIIRWRRMAGDEALWVPGTDHAGIATQNIIEKQLAAEGKSKFDLGRAAFVERTISFVEQTGSEILQQLRAIGASCDWNRTAYTLSPELSRAVREAFVQLYERGLIYRGHRVIHWCPRCLTSLSDEEAQHGEELGTLYHIAYPVVGAKDQSSLTVATTRPETMLGDVAVAVHPDDERYKKLIGKSVLLPIANVEIPIIADEYVDPAFGTGVVKITPAHDPNDFEVGMRHKLQMPVIMAPDGTMANGADADSRVPPELVGVDRFEARERIVRSLEKSRLLKKVEPHQHAVRHCYRCDTVVEPRLSDQWFVRMESLAKPALAAVRDGTIRILPERWEAVYINWLENIRDWNISRQLWWGHRIPVWYCDSCNKQIVSRTDVTACDKCGGPARQNERCARHLVLVVAIPNLYAGMARQERSCARRVLSDGRSHYRAGDSFFLGLANDHGGLRVHGRPALSHRLSARDGARHSSPQDVEVAWQRYRSTRRRRQIRCRCASVHGYRRNGHGRGPRARS